MYGSISVILKFIIFGIAVSVHAEMVRICRQKRGKGGESHAYSKQNHLVCLSVSSLALSRNRFLLDVV
jgi:hypothetical protein